MFLMLSSHYFLRLFILRICPDFYLRLLFVSFLLQIGLTGNIVLIQGPQ